MERYVCVHGHFYQPPRENPWLEAVEIQDSAFPSHDWNERITAECYGPNSASRILDGEQRILDIVSNYAKMSFNFGPTLLSWMQNEAPEVYEAILEADRQSLKQRSGHGAAIAQVYNHMIMPLATRRDKQTQIIWGIRDFEHRFKRSPEGMWLAETAVDLETLDLLAEQGIKYTILAPHQAARFRKIGNIEWTETENGSIDPTCSYLCRLPSKRKITLFFYDRLAQAVAFEKVLDNGEVFARRILDIYSESRNWPQLLHIATDGETYGHHQKFGDMGLAAAFDYIETNQLARITNYGEYLELCPPVHEAEIHENSSWSCAHGVERWRSNCGCNSGGYTHWNQEWRAPLRSALDWLRDQLTVEFEHAGSKLLKNPWDARNDFIELILNRQGENIENFLAKHSSRELDADETVQVMKLLEMQRHSMLMYTSCGWFFDELSGLETVQVIQYASRALQLAAGIATESLEKTFMEKLEKASSNIPEIRDGAWIYQNFVLPAKVDHDKVCAHFAFSSIFEEYEKMSRIFCYAVVREEDTRVSSEDATLAMGLVDVISDITGETARFMFSVVRFGSHDFKGGVTAFNDEATYEAMREEMIAAFDKGLYTDLISLMDKYMGTHNYSFNNLFRDEQRKILKLIIKEKFVEFSDTYVDLYQHSRPLMEFMQEFRIPVPRTFLIAAQPALNAEIKKVLTEDEPDVAAVQRIIDQIHKWDVEIGSHTEFFIRKYLERLIRELKKKPTSLDLLRRLLTVLELARLIPLKLVLWQVQNDYFEMAKSTYPMILTKAWACDDEGLTLWLGTFRKLGDILYFNTDAILTEGK